MNSRQFMTFLIKFHLLPIKQSKNGCIKFDFINPVLLLSTSIRLVLVAVFNYIFFSYSPLLSLDVKTVAEVVFIDIVLSSGSILPIFTAVAARRIGHEALEGETVLTRRLMLTSLLIVVIYIGVQILLIPHFSGAPLQIKAAAMLTRILINISGVVDNSAFLLTPFIWIKDFQIECRHLSTKHHPIKVEDVEQIISRYHTLKYGLEISCLFVFATLQPVSVCSAYLLVIGRNFVKE